MDQAENENQNLPWHLAQRRTDADLGAMCLYLLLAYIRFMSKLGLGMQQILRLLQLDLFERRDLMALLRGDPP